MGRMMLNYTRDYFSCLADCKLYEAVKQLKDVLQEYDNLPEPVYVAAIVRHFPHLIQGYWNDIKMGGCFIHQSPYVTMENGDCCELGDLLVISRKVVDNVERHNAVLFQVKKAQKSYMGIQKPDKEKQLKLYTTWPRFCFGHKYNSSKRTYDIHPKVATSSAQYMFINEAPSFWVRYEDDTYVEHPVMFTHNIPSARIENDRELSFGRFLWYFMNWQIGRPVDLVNYSCDNWSYLVHDAIEKTRKALIPRSATPDSQERFPRNNGEFFQFLLKNERPDIYTLEELRKISWNIANDNNTNEGNDEENDGAISILFIDLGGEKFRVED